MLPFSPCLPFSRPPFAHLSFARPALARLALLAGLAALPAEAGSRESHLAAAFAAQDPATRSALQERLAEVDLFVGLPNGRWSGATGRALMRSADRIALETGGRLHADLGSVRSSARFLADLSAGRFDRYLAAPEPDGGASGSGASGGADDGLFGWLTR